MKVGILTFHARDNYGAVLQAWALQEALRRLGHEVEIIDFDDRKRISRARRWLSARPSNLVRKWEAEYRARMFEGFRRRRLCRSARCRTLEELSAIAAHYDAIIAGSDQIWNPMWLNQNPVYWDLYFATFATPHQRLLSYAASFGQPSATGFGESDRMRLADRLRRFHAISVREASGVEIVRELCGRTDAEPVPDPTLLLETGVYHAVADSAKPPGRGRPYVFAFALHQVEEPVRRLAAEAARACDAEVWFCDARRRFSRRTLLPSPEGWLRCIREARFVVTNSFHATVFALHFRVPFATVGMEGTLAVMNDRLVGLLNAADCARRLVSPTDNGADHLWTLSAEEERGIVALVSGSRQKGLDFLERHLGSIAVRPKPESRG